MTYTITFSPSLDCIAVCEDFRLGETNRVSRETIFPGEGIRKLVIEKGIRNEMIRGKKKKPRESTGPEDDKHMRTHAMLITGIHVIGIFRNMKRGKCLYGQDSSCR